MTEKEEWDEREQDFLETPLKNIWPTCRKKLYYLFDFGDKWIFEIRKDRKAKEPELGIKYTRVIKAIGPNPEQYRTL
jgi:hypothetical protein